MKLSWIAWMFAVMSMSAAIAVACWITRSGWPLWAFILFPSMETSSDPNPYEEQEKKER